MTVVYKYRNNFFQDRLYLVHILNQIAHWENKIIQNSWLIECKDHDFEKKYKRNWKRRREERRSKVKEKKKKIKRNDKLEIFKKIVDFIDFLILLRA